MVALHAAFHNRGLVLWGESSSPDAKQRRISGRHPFEAGPDELLRTLSLLGIEKGRREYTEAEIWLPSTRTGPVPSSPLIANVPKVAKPRLRPWTITVAERHGTDLLDLLCAVKGKDLLHPGVIAGADLAFWSAAMRLAASLVARQHFLPTVLQEDESFVARWRAAWIGRDDDHRCALAA